MWTNCLPEVLLRSKNYKRAFLLRFGYIWRIWEVSFFNFPCNIYTITIVFVILDFGFCCNSVTCNQGNTNISYKKKKKKMDGCIKSWVFCCSILTKNRWQSKHVLQPKYCRVEIPHLWYTPSEHYFTNRKCFPGQRKKHNI